PGPLSLPAPVLICLPDLPSDCCWILPAFSLKNCTILYQENTSPDLSLDCAKMKFVTIPDYIPKNVTSLQLGENLLINITRNDFNDIKKLSYLNLTLNEITYVDQGSFINLGLLDTLHMARNRLTNLTNNMFNGLSNLRVLVLSSNNIQYIHKYAFEGLTSLQTLDIIHNRLQEIVEILPILRLPQLLTLNLKFNTITKNTKYFNQNFSSCLKELEVSGPALKLLSITATICPHLQTIELSLPSSKGKWDLTDNRLLKNITKLYAESEAMSLKGIQTVLENIARLDHLVFDTVDDWIKDGILPSSVCKTPTLKKLSITRTHVDNFTIGLASCSQLRELDLEDNYMHELSKGSMQSMKQLQSLNLAYNMLTKVPHDIRCLFSLEILKLCYNDIAGLSCDDFLNNTHLKELYLNNNRISKLEKCVTKNLDNLKVLDLSNNQLKTFEDTFKVSLHKLEALDISHNPIKYLDTDEFQHLKSLKDLKVETYLFVNVPYFSGLESLENLVVYLNTNTYLKSLQSNNDKASAKIKTQKHLTLIGSSNYELMPFHVIKEMLKAYENVETFSVFNIYINDLDVETFELNLQLKSLTLSSMDLLYFNSTLLLPLPNLQNLDLSKSKLRSLDFLVQANLSALRSLKLTDNEITVISETVFQSLPSLRLLDLDNNPFLCECSNAGFIHWVLTNPQTQVVKAHQYKCFSPVVKQESLLLDFDIQSCRQDIGFPYFISTTFLVVFTLFASLFYKFLRWHISYTFHRFLALLYDSKMRKKEDPHRFDAFVSYNVHDEDWVYRELLPELEGEQGWRLCLHHRDFQPGKPIIENITDAIYESRKTICVISRHYLLSEWCSREIQMASFRLFDEQKGVLILLFLEEIPTYHLSALYGMRNLVKKRTYLSWPQAAQHPRLFWQNVKRALQTGDALTENTDLLTGQTTY
uniref:Toll-like receptor 13 n=1 Tax=Cyprinodon variegatus TaxID=28743 RepID=A0A3Q2DLR1_CYPVA